MCEALTNNSKLKRKQAAGVGRCTTAMRRGVGGGSVYLVQLVLLHWHEGVFKMLMLKFIWELGLIFLQRITGAEPTIEALMH